MWVFRNDSFVSAVQDRDTSDILWIRARVHGDIERFFKGFEDFVPEVIEMDKSDYRFRCIVTKAQFATVLVSAINSLDYDNFKGSIPENLEGDRRHDWYMRIWSVGMLEQRNEIHREEMSKRHTRKKGKKKGSQA